MTPAQITAWAVTGESETQEFMRSTGQRREAARTLCAMLNHRGGRVLFGVEPDARVVDQQVSGHTLEEVAQEPREIEPPVFPTIDRVVVDGEREVLVVSVDAGHSQPYTHHGQAYRRVGTTNQALSREEYNRVFLERLHADSRWELQPAAGWSVADLDHEEIRRTVEAGTHAGRIEDPDTRDPLAILRGLGLVKRDKLLRAVVVLFGRADRLLPDFAQCLLRVARFRGTEKGEFLDNRQFHGHAYDLFQRAQRFLMNHMPIAGRFEPGRMKRIDEPAYSPLAFPEAIANAICHRDYATGDSSTGVAMYDDRLEVSSSGTLYSGFPPQALFEPHESRPWNPLIASVFYRRGIIETWRQGTLRMAAWAAEAGLPKPEILEIPGAVVVRLQRTPTVRTTEETPPEEAGCDPCTASGTAWVRPGTSNLFLLRWASAAHDEIVSHANGSTFLGIGKSGFRPIRTVAPAAPVMHAFDRVSHPMYLKVVELERESRTLAALRDALLPRLISGELRVGGATTATSTDRWTPHSQPGASLRHNAASTPLAFPTTAGGHRDHRRTQLSS